MVSLGRVVLLLLLLLLLLIGGVVVLTALTGVFGDRGDAVSVAGRAASYEDVLGAAGAVAADLAGWGPVPAFAVTATASLETVAAVVGGLLAGVPCTGAP